MNRNMLGFACFVFVALGLTSGGCSSSSTPSSATDTTRDGTYDFSFVYNNNGTPTTVVLQRYFIVSDGVISSNPAELSGSVLDSFGNVEFTGPCPVGDGGAVFTGTLNLRNPLGGMGDWTCNVGGASLTWRAYNGG